ncbi:PIG-L family deacetylase [Piscinibacter sp. XHJ-5]|uniref:PIG-L deacetylase family protein n=1 Tax=Piscinibacter sp. XHJ-5 TaxID=3037797 RepID=UPI00245284CA|nr:PIG-L family deacetylase [Piscinibacter sp. XHJ-5]
MTANATTLVISPHLDDAVLSCGRCLAAHPGSIVVTVFAGTPRDAGRRTDWDARCGFGDAAQALAVRREEDALALSRLGAAAHWLEFADSQYGETPSTDDLGRALLRVIADVRPGLVLYPLGLYHSDHLLAHQASRAALSAWPALVGAAYEDSPYRGLRGLLQQRLAALAAGGVCATPARLAAHDEHAQRKRTAIEAYASQLRAFGTGGLDDAALPERFWTLDEAGDRDVA